MSNWAISPVGQRIGTEGISTAASDLTASLSVSSVNTKGSWVQITAATAFEADGIILHFYGSGGFNGDRNAVVDLGIGAAASEAVILENFRQDYVRGSMNKSAGSLFIPLAIPSGSRVAARMSADSTAVGVHIGLTIVKGGSLFPTGFGKIESLGHNTSNDRGTQISASATANTKGSWAEIVASTAKDYAGFFGVLGNAGDMASANERRLIDIGIGAAASETVIVPNWYTNFEGLGDVNQPMHMPIFWTPLAAGTRIAARFQQDLTSNLNLDLMLYGIVEGS